MRRVLLVLTLGLSMLAGSTQANAQCKEDPRLIHSGDDPDTGTVRLKSFLCRVEDGQQGRQIRVEFHRLSEVAASMLVSDRASSQVGDVLGSPAIGDNDVKKTYADLLRQFGMALAPSLVSYRNITAAGGGGTTRSVSDESLPQGLRSLVGVRDAIAYPAVDEVTTLHRGVIPEGMKYHSYANCLEPPVDEPDLVPPTDTCREYDRKSAGLIFWRGLRPSDLTSYASRLAAYNRLVGRDHFMEPAIPASLRLTSHVAGDNWPEDFLILIGYVAGCPWNSGGRPRTKDWTTAFWMREIILDVAIIENLSSLPIEIGGLFGVRTATPRLRAAGSSGSSPSTPLDFKSTPLGPSQRLLIPTKITFAAPEGLTGFFQSQKTSDVTYRRFGTFGFRGNVRARGVPSFTNYVFGPEIALKGLHVNGKRIELARPSHNFFDLALGHDGGSCPYLLSWDRSEREWIDHGKILHQAPGKEHEYSEERVFAGFRSHFRIEEREPEIAFIGRTELTVQLKNGGKLVLRPANRNVGAPDAPYVQLYWGETADIHFSLPENVLEEDVVESRLAVTGYYERYSIRLPDRASRPAPLSRRLVMQLANDRQAIAAGPVCPTPLPSRNNAEGGSRWRQ